MSSIFCFLMGVWSPMLVGLMKPAFISHIVYKEEIVWTTHYPPGEDLLFGYTLISSWRSSKTSKCIVFWCIRPLYTRFKTRDQASGSYWECIDYIPTFKHFFALHLMLSVFVALLVRLAPIANPVTIATSWWPHTLTFKTVFCLKSRRLGLEWWRSCSVIGLPSSTQIAIFN